MRSETRYFVIDLVVAKLIRFSAREKFPSICRLNAHCIEENLGGFCIVVEILVYEKSMAEHYCGHNFYTG